MAASTLPTSLPTSLPLPLPDSVPLSEDGPDSTASAREASACGSLGLGLVFVSCPRSLTASSSRTPPLLLLLLRQAHALFL